jgi:hypothetical protein
MAKQCDTILNYMLLYTKLNDILPEKTLVYRD